MRPRLALMQAYTPGAIARVTELHALEYHARAGFGLDFETGVARGLCEFADNARPGRDAQGWPQVYLWTFAALDAARHLYDAQGFVCTHEATGSRWGRPVLEQRLVRQRIDSR